MAKPDPALLDAARYPYRCAITTRFGDLDSNLHLNNVALVGLLEDGRVRFHHATGFRAAIGAGTLMVASFAIEYLAQAWYPQPVEVHAAVARVGGSSFTLYQLVAQEDRIVSFAQSVMVCVADDRPITIPAGFAAGIAQWRLRP